MRYLLLIVLCILLLSSKSCLLSNLDCSCNSISFRRLEDDGKSSCENGEFRNGTCICNDGQGNSRTISNSSFVGELCNVECPVSGDGDPCDNHGKCVLNSDGTSASCTCDKGYYGSTCESSSPGLVITSDSVLECSGHGTCNPETLECTCEEGVKNQETCSMKECSADTCIHGTCVNGVCQCNANYYGATCATFCDMHTMPLLRRLRRRSLRGAQRRLLLPGGSAAARQRRRRLSLVPLARWFTRRASWIERLGLRTQSVVARLSLSSLGRSRSTPTSWPRGASARRRRRRRRRRATRTRIRCRP